MSVYKLRKVRFRYYCSATVLLCHRFGIHTMAAGLFLRILDFLVNFTSKWRTEE